jgi:hypothetical protein
MARYIDADKIHEFVDAKVAEGKDGWAKGVPYEWAYALTVIDMQPAANVVPKSEVAREIFEEIERKVKSLLTLHLEEINKEYIRDTPLYDRHSGIIFALQGMDDFIAELKKKYTEDSDES